MQVKQHALSSTSNSGDQSGKTPVTNKDYKPSHGMTKIPMKGVCLFEGMKNMYCETIIHIILCTISLAIFYVSHLFSAYLCPSTNNFNCNDENRILDK